MKISLLVFAALATFASAQQKPDESLVTRPAEGIDFPGCWSDLNKADRNGNGFVTRNEYLNFIQEYGKRICFETDALTLQQISTFNTLACICRSQEGADFNCCIGDAAQIPTAGAVSNSRTPTQKNYLTSVCKLTDATIDGRCAPTVEERDPPPPGLVADPPSDGGLAPGILYGIIAAAALLALALCCCCCVWRKKKMREEEEAEEAARTAAAASPKEIPQEQAPSIPPGPHLLRPVKRDPEDVAPHDGGADESDINPIGAAMAASGSAVADDSDEDEEGRKRRGGGNLPPDDEEAGLRIPTAPRLPPPDDPNNPPPKLKPIPPKENEDDEWDHPGRNIDFPKDKDEMSAGEVDHYEPDGGVYLPEREGKDPLDWKKDWNRPKPEEPDEVDDRKHRIQSGLGEGEVWDKLGEEETTERSKQPQGDVFDWVVQSALGVLDKSDEATP